MNVERRKFERVSCYMIVRQSGRGSDEDDFFGVVRNISNGGAMIESDYSVSVGMQMDLAFLLEQEDQIWEARGRVVWAREKEGHNIFGLQFTSPLEENWQRTFPAVERRKHPRQPCQWAVHWSESYSHGGNVMGTVRNISLDGAMIETSYELEIDDRLELVFVQPPDHRVWEGRVKVIWTRTRGELAQFGLQLMDPCEESGPLSGKSK